MPKRPAERVLNEREQLFVQEYPVDLNGTQAAIRAGYSERSAGVTASRLLTRANVQVAIAESFKARSVRTEITQDRVLKELAILAFSDMGIYAKWGATGVTLVASDELPGDATRAVAEVSEHITEGGSTLKFKLHDKRGALELLMKHLGMLIDRSSVDMAGDVNFTLSFETPDGRIVDADTWQIMQLEEGEEERDS